VVLFALFAINLEARFEHSNPTLTQESQVHRNIQQVKMTSHRPDSYLSSSAMRATSSSMALASSVLGFEIVEIWSETESGKLHCTYVHAEDRTKERYPGIITGHYPQHKREHKLSPKVRMLSAITLFSDLLTRRNTFCSCVN
jgi:hypothetical protein